MISHIYGSYNLWTWFRSEFIDSMPLQTLMSLDKQYVDHNYGNAKKKDNGMHDIDLFAEIERQKRELAKLTHTESEWQIY